MAELQVGVLRPDVELIKNSEPLLFDRASDNYYKISEKMLEIISFLSESMPLTQFLDLLKENSIYATKDEVVKLLIFLQQNNLLISKYGHINVKRQQQFELKKKTAFLRYSNAYLFFKLPPWRPELFFEKISPYVSFLASKFVVILLAIPAIIGYFMMLKNFPLIRNTFVDTLSWAGLAKYFVCIIFLKVIHEVAHSLAAIRFNCRVRAIGIGFMIFYPRLYTDVTDSWRLPRNKRLLIDSAGLIIELFLGGIAVLLWMYLSPGIYKSTMFYVFAVSTISTLFVNGNPLIRYDGYYIFCDLLKVDNLMSRSNEYIKRFWRWHFLKVGSMPIDKHSLLFLIFGISSFIYRILLYTSIILIIYHKFIKSIAIILMAMEIYTILIYPCYQEIKTIKNLSKKSANKARRYLSIALLIILLLILFLPLSWNINLFAEIVPIKKSIITINESGFLTSPLSNKAINVKENEIIAQLFSPQLDNAIEKLFYTQKYDEILYDYQSLDEKLFASSKIIAGKILSDKLCMKELKRRKKELTIRATMNGFFVPLKGNLSTGAFLNKGEKIGEIVAPQPKIYAYATDNEVGKLKVNDNAVMYFNDSLKRYKCKIISINKVATKLKNSPLLQHFGGPIPVYINNEQANSYSSVLSLYRIELSFNTIPKCAIGRVVNVEISHSEQLYKILLQFILSILRKEL